MTVEEYKEQIFKYDGQSKPVKISEIWNNISRLDRRKIERRIKKGHNPDITTYF